MSNDDGAVELYLSDPEVSEPDDAADVEIQNLCIWGRWSFKDICSRMERIGVEGTEKGADSLGS